MHLLCVCMYVFYVLYSYAHMNTYLYMNAYFIYMYIMYICIFWKLPTQHVRLFWFIMSDSLLATIQLESINKESVLNKRYNNLYICYPRPRKEWAGSRPKRTLESRSSAKGGNRPFREAFWGHKQKARRKTRPDGAGR